MPWFAADTGKSIDAANAERYFERFYKVDEFVPGIGLGLPIAQLHALRLGRRDYIDTSYGRKGSRFVVEQ